MTKVVRVARVSWEAGRADEGEDAGKALHTVAGVARPCMLWLCLKYEQQSKLSSPNNAQVALPAICKLWSR